MEFPRSILAIDVGGGTQDILIWEKGKSMENSVQMVLPSPTQIVAKRIRMATSEGKGIFLSGNLMGGGTCVWALKEHLKAGLSVHSTPIAAKTIHDNLDKVSKMGVKICERPPDEMDFVKIELRDIDIESLKTSLSRFEIELPSHYSIAVQDHGECLEGSNRKFRFLHWRRFILEDGMLLRSGSFQPPDYMTRMRAVQLDCPNAFVMDTAMSAILGALCDPLVEERSKGGVLIINMGNQHCLAVMVKEGKVWGIFEHHTGVLHPKSLISFMDRFIKGDLSDEEVFEDGGHGCFIHPDRPKDSRWDFIVITGPMRHLGQPLGGYLASPWGNMMLIGCFGLVRAYMESIGLPWKEEMGKG
jgi:uncharacterized protein (DUF1786 family)